MSSSSSSMSWLFLFSSGFSESFSSLSSSFYFSNSSCLILSSSFYCLCWFYLSVIFFSSMAFLSLSVFKSTASWSYTSYSLLFSIYIDKTTLITSSSSKLSSTLLADFVGAFSDGKLSGGFSSSSLVSDSMSSMWFFFTRT